jgi:hypothetical protein
MTPDTLSPRPAADGPRALFRDAFARLVMIDAAGQEYVGVEVVRAFPISEPDRWISICDVDGHEIVALDDIRQLPQEIRTVVLDELAKREFVPVIRRIVKVWDQTNPQEWHVVTDRGPTSFCVDSDEDIRRMEPRQVLIVDGHGIRYLIPDTQQLDSRSRRILDRFE